MRRPGEMLRDQRGLVAFDEPSKAFEMRLVQWMRGADRHAHAVQRNGIVSADGVQRPMRRTAGAHIVLGVDLEEAAHLGRLENRRQMLGLEACSRKPLDGMGRKAKSGRAWDVPR